MKNKIIKLNRRTWVIPFLVTFFLTAQVSGKTNLNAPLYNTITGYYTVGTTQTIIIKGVVKDAAGMPLPSVSILIEGTNRGTLTDFEGKYEISGTAGEVLVFSYVGMKTTTVTIGDSSTINMTLKSTTSILDEVVVVGYGTQKKGNLTGSVASINAKRLTIAPMMSASNALVGQLSGLSALQTSGLPGSDAAQLRIRGFGDALVIIDGIEGNLNNLDPSQIESVSILKDGAASIYGSRAGNGVLLVTTKRGKNQKPTITLNSSFTVQGITRILRPASSGQMAQMDRETYLQSGKNPSGVPWTQEAVDKFFAGGDPAYPNTNWYAHTFRDWAPQQNHNLSVQGGSDKIKYFGYFGYAKQETMVKTNGGDYKRYNIQSNIDAKITDNLKIAIDLSMVSKDKNFPIRGMENESAFWQDYYLTKPWYPATLPDPNKVAWGGINVGSIATISNIDLMGYKRSNDKTVQGIATLTYDFPKIMGLQAKANVNYSSNDVYAKSFQKPIVFWTYNPANQVYTASGSFTQSNLSEAIYRSRSFTQQYSLNYNHTFAKKHTVSGLVLFESIDYKSNNFNASRTNLLTPYIDQLFIGSTIGMGNNGAASEMGRMSYVGRMNYGYDNRYLLETIFRADASAKFPSQNRWGYFPSISLGWVISKETFMKDLSAIDNLKLRTSYGQSGNDGVGNFQYLSGYSSRGSVLFDDRQIGGIFITGLANPLLTWEKMAISNAGLDYSFWNQKIYGSLDVFRRQRTGIPATRATSLPSTFGSSLPPENLNSLTDRGFELSLGTKGGSDNFSYDINANISWSRAKWDHYEEPTYANPDQERLYKQSGQWTDRVMGYVSEGLFTSYDQITKLKYTYEALGGNKTLEIGDVRYKDLNNDGVLNWKDQTEIGKGSFPHWTYGINTMLQYKNFSFTTLFQGAFGYSTNVNITNYPNEVMYDLRWTEANDNPNALVPRLGGSSSNYYMSDYQLKNTSYIRLKSASFGYQFPKSLLDRMSVDNLRVYVAGTNLLTWSTLDKYRIDPEVASGSIMVYPQQRTISVGLSLSL